MKPLAILALLLAILLSGCATRQPLTAARQVVSIAPRTDTVKQAMVQTRATVVKAATATQQATQRADEVQVMAKQIASEGTTANSKEAVAMVAKVEELKAQLGTTTEQLGQAQADITVGDTQIAVLTAQVDQQTKELNANTSALNTAVAERDGQIVQVALEKDRADRWRKYAAWLGVVSLTLAAGLYIALRSKLPF